MKPNLSSNRPTCILDLTYHISSWNPYILIHNREYDVIYGISKYAGAKDSTLQSDILYIVEQDELPSVLFQSRSQPLNILCFADIQPPLMSDENFFNLNMILIRDKTANFDDIIHTLLEVIIGNRVTPSPHEILLQQLSLNNDNQRTLATGIKRILGNPVFIRDTSLELISTSVDDHKVNAGNFREQIFYTKEMLDTLASIKKPCICTDGQSVPCILAPVFISSLLAAYIFIPAHYAAFGEHDLEYAGLAAQAVAIEMQKNSMFRFQSGFAYDYFLLRLIEAAPGQKVMFDPDAIHLHFDSSSYLFLAIFELPAKLKVPTLSSRLLARDLNSICGGKLYAIHDGNIVMLLSRRERIPFQDSQHNELCAFLQQRDIIMGISRPYTNLEDTSRYYLSVINIIQHAKFVQAPGSIFDHDGMIGYMLLSNYASRYALEHCMSSKIEEIIAYDQQYRTQYFATLKTFVDHCLSTKDTAEVLGIHRNTMQYRIKNIQDLFDFDLGDIHNLFHVILAGYVLELQNKYESKQYLE